MEKIIDEWNIHNYVRKQDREVLEMALEEKFKRKFIPITVVSQINDGVNYMFICGAISDNSKLKVELVKVYIHVSNGEKPQLKRIEKFID